METVTEQGPRQDITDGTESYGKQTGTERNTNLSRRVGGHVYVRDPGAASNRTGGPIGTKRPDEGMGVSKFLGGRRGL